MMQKLEKVLDLLIAWLERDLGAQGLPLREKEAAAAVVSAEKKTKKKANPVEEPSEVLENADAAKKRCIEAMGAYIRKYDLAKAKAINNEVCGREIAKLEQISYEENIRLANRFEKELAAA